MTDAIRHTVEFCRDPGTVFDTVTTLAHWPLWYPATRSVDTDRIGPALPGDTALERVQVLGMAGTLRWNVVESHRPSRFAIETTSIDLPMLRRARFRIRYELEPTPAGTRMVRTWHYDLGGAVAALDRVIRWHLTGESSRALRRLERLVGRAPSASDLAGLTDRVIDAWNRQDVDQVVSCYTDDCRYVDPNTRGEVQGRDALRRYLSALFARWQMHWTITERHEFTPHAGLRGGAFLWRAELAPRGVPAPAHTITGMDLVLVRGDLLWRNEVYFGAQVSASAAIGPD